MSKRRIFLVLGISIFMLGFVVLLRIPFFYYHAKVTSHDLLQQAHQQISVSESNSNSTDSHNIVKDYKGSHTDIHNVSSSTPKTNAYDNHRLLGDILIPKLNMNAPLLDGTDDDALSVAIGHLSTSVLPGKNGTSILAAHNATWFRHVDELVKGDIIQVQTVSGNYSYRVINKKVVRVGDAIINTPNATLVLESCYPLDALHLTSYRYLVFGDLVKQ